MSPIARKKPTFLINNFGMCFPIYVGKLHWFTVTSSLQFNEKCPMICNCHCISSDLSVIQFPLLPCFVTGTPVHVSVRVVEGSTTDPLISCSSVCARVMPKYLKGMRDFLDNLLTIWNNGNYYRHRMFFLVSNEFLMRDWKSW